MIIYSRAFQFSLRRPRTILYKKKIPCGKHIYNASRKTLRVFHKWNVFFAVVQFFHNIPMHMLIRWICKTITFTTVRKAAKNKRDHRIIMPINRRQRFLYNVLYDYNSFMQKSCVPLNKRFSPIPYVLLHHRPFQSDLFSMVASDFHSDDRGID
jgi:hypothetical protein